MTLVATACGGRPTPAPAVLDPSLRTQSFGAYSLSVGRAVSDALSGRAVPEHFLCGGADLGQTAPKDKQSFRELGPTPAMVMTGFRVSIYGKSSAAAPKEEARDVPGPGATVFLHGRTFTPPDGRTVWVEFNGYLATMETPQENRAVLSTLAAPLHSGLAEALTAARSTACDVPILTERTLDALPYAPSPDEKQTILSEMATVTRGLPRACRAAQFGDDPWEAHFHHADLVYRGNGRLARVRARVHIVADRLCVGPAEVMKVVSGD